MNFVALVKELAGAVRSDGENLASVAGSDKQRPRGIEGKSPNVLGLGVEKYGVLAVGSDFVDFAVGRSCDVEVILLVDGQGLSFKFAGLKYGGRLFRCVDAHDFRIGTARGVEASSGIGGEGPDVGESWIGERLEFGRGHERSIAAQGDALVRPFVEFVEGGLLPESSVFGASYHGAEEGRRKNAQKGESPHGLSRNLFEGWDHLTVTARYCWPVIT